MTATKKPTKKAAAYSTDDRGRIRLYVGFHSNGKGRRVQMPFYFGTDPAQVPARLARVNELWQHTCQEWAKPIPRPFRIAADPWQREGLPVWDEDGKYLAKQLAAGKVQITVGRLKDIPSTPAHPSQPVVMTSETSYAFAERMKMLAKRWPMVWFVPAPNDEQPYSEGAAFIQESVDHQLERITGTPARLLPAKSETLYQALDAYLAALPTLAVEPTPDGPQLTGQGTNRINYTTHFEQHFKDQPLSTLDAEGIQTLADYWRNRPISATTKGPMSHAYCKHHLAELKSFFKWVSKSKQFNWRKPEEFDDLNWRVRKMVEEKTSITNFTQVQTYTVDELAVLYKHATQLERLLILLGLNCAFGGGEMGTVKEMHLFLDGPHPNEKYLRQFGFVPKPEDRFLVFVRQKTEVMGEFLLWPETIKAIRWMLARKAEHDSPYLLVTQDGKPFYRRTSGGKNISQIFTKKWQDLHDRIEKLGGSVRRLSFGKLRKTATDAMRQLTKNGEAASAFELHGSPTTDDLLEFYSNRPSGVIFEGLRMMHEMWQPVFNQALLFPDDERKERCRKPR